MFCAFVVSLLNLVPGDWSNFIFCRSISLSHSLSLPFLCFVSPSNKCVQIRETRNIFDCTLDGIQHPASTLIFIKHRKISKQNTSICMNEFKFKFVQLLLSFCCCFSCFKLYNLLLWLQNDLVFGYNTNIESKSKEEEAYNHYFLSKIYRNRFHPRSTLISFQKKSCK